MPCLNETPPGQMVPAHMYISMMCKNCICMYTYVSKYVISSPIKPSFLGVFNVNVGWDSSDCYIWGVASCDLFWVV